MIELIQVAGVSTVDAFDFAMGLTDLDYHEPCDNLRRIMGALVLDTLQYNEHWRLAGLVRLALAEKWPGFFS